MAFTSYFYRKQRQHYLDDIVSVSLRDASGVEVANVLKSDAAKFTVIDDAVDSPLVFQVVVTGADCNALPATIAKYAVKDATGELDAGDNDVSVELKNDGSSTTVTITTTNPL